MDFHAHKYYSSSALSGLSGHFHQVIPLHDTPHLQWEEVKKLSPTMSRGWYELSRLSFQDRLEFTQDFWLTKLPYSPAFHEFLDSFFAGLDDIGVFLTQQKYQDPFVPHIVYSLKHNSGFFQGGVPASDEAIISLQKEFPNYILPADYLAFLQIHDGFAKFTDTGIVPSRDMKSCYDRFQMLIQETEGVVTTSNGDRVNPSLLIPFYESFGLPFFQCFWAEWYPDQEMGNVYFSLSLKKIATSINREESAETLAFQTFMDWLMFYLEIVCK